MAVEVQCGICKCGICQCGICKCEICKCGDGSLTRPGPQGRRFSGCAGSCRASLGWTGQRPVPTSARPHIRRADYCGTSFSTLPLRSTTYTSPAASCPNEVIVRPVESNSVRFQVLPGASVRLQIFPVRSPKM